MKDAIAWIVVILFILWIGLSGLRALLTATSRMGRRRDEILAEQAAQSQFFERRAADEINIARSELQDAFAQQPAPTVRKQRPAARKLQQRKPEPFTSGQVPLEK